MKTFEEGQFVAAWGYGEVLLGHIASRYDYDCHQIRLLVGGFRIVPTNELRTPTAMDIQVWLDTPITSLGGTA